MGEVTPSHVVAGLRAHMLLPRSTTRNFDPSPSFDDSTKRCWLGSLNQKPILGKTVTAVKAITLSCKRQPASHLHQCLTWYDSSPHFLRLSIHTWKTCQTLANLTGDLTHSWRNHSDRSCVCTMFWHIQLVTKGGKGRSQTSRNVTRFFRISLVFLMPPKVPALTQSLIEGSLYHTVLPDQDIRSLLRSVERYALDSRNQQLVFPSDFAQTECATRLPAACIAGVFEIHEDQVWKI
jgi:hypothetical protein